MARRGPISTCCIPLLLFSLSFHGCDDDPAQQPDGDGAPDAVSDGLGHDGAGPTSAWTARYGTPGSERAFAVAAATGGGFIVAGEIGTDKRGTDAWVLRLDDEGDITWQKAYGGGQHDAAHVVRQTQEGGFVVVGSRGPSNIDPSDVWVLKLDEKGDVTWQKTYGDKHGDQGLCGRQTEDGGYIVGGWASPLASSSGTDAWVLKLDEKGEITWQKTYGGDKGDAVNDIQQTEDGGYVAAGSSSSFGSGGLMGAWVLKLDGDGNIDWQKLYRDGKGAHGYAPSAVYEAEGGGYVVAGQRSTPGASGHGEAWVLRLGGDGDVTWQGTYGGPYNDSASAIRPAEGGGGHIIAGYTDSFVTGARHAWLLKLEDKSGGIVWQRVYGESKGAYLAGAIQQTLDGGFVTAGSTDTKSDRDVWVAKVDPAGEIEGCGILSAGSGKAQTSSITSVSTTAKVGTQTLTGTPDPAKALDTQATRTVICPVP